jgi:hypothetical protein
MDGGSGMKRGAPLGVGDWVRQGYFGTAGTGHERVRDGLKCGLVREGTASMLPCMTWKDTQVVAE